MAYSDGRPAASRRVQAVDHGIVLQCGIGPAHCDVYGARDPVLWQHDGIYYLHYDGAGYDGWRCCLATSSDLIHWDKKGPVLDMGPPGSDDHGSASYGYPYFDGKRWHLFYLGTPNVGGEIERVPNFPYLTMKATGPTPAGPWIKQNDIRPLQCIDGTYHSVTSSPGQILLHKGKYLQFFSAATIQNGTTLRSIGLARADQLDGPWIPNSEPILPLQEQIENTSFYFDQDSHTWYMFTNHVGISNHRDEYTDAVWVYWTEDLEHWQPENKAVVLDGENCMWSKKCIGLPTVLKTQGKLALLYDAPGCVSTSHMLRHIGLAWVELPMVIS